MPGSADIEQLFDLQYVIPEDLVTCKLCSGVFKSPHTLPCLHTFCRTCLEVEQISRDAGNKTVACPTCDYGCKLDCVQEQTPRTNFFLAGLADSFWELRCKGSTLSKHQCALCTEKLCVIACGGCSLRMCSKCALSHISKNPPRDHRLFRLEEGSMSLMNDDAVRPHRDEKISCRHHPDNQIQSFCCTCNVPTCTKCVMEDHGKPGHEISFMAGVARMKQQDLKQAMKLLKTQAKFINKGILAAKTEADKITEHSAKAKSKIDSHAENLIAQIMNMKELAKNKVRDLVQLKTNILKNQINELEKRVAAIQSTEKFANALLKYANPAEYLTSEDTLCNRVLQLVNEDVQYTPKETGDVIFEVDEAPVQHGFGILRSTSVSGDNSSCTRVKTVFRVGEEQKIVIATRNRENEIVAAYNSVTAELAYPSGKTKELDVEHNLDDLSHTVKFCCLDEGKYLLKVNVGGFPLNGSPFTIKVVPQEGTFKEFGGFGDTIMDTPPSIEGVAINLQNHVVLADKTNHQLQILDSFCNYAGSVEFRICRSRFLRMTLRCRTMVSVLWPMMLTKKWSSGAREMKLPGHLVKENSTARKVWP
ncbi:E3 ubiquitin-protein ligase TRIM71-like [Ptychodera flava]|uniref:E3 ubiquitin-protein ligase TRIM71-like n=1 Tax=Ptychodera flava TaxID=63121 RepID=UPI00396A7BFF